MLLVKLLEFAFFLLLLGNIDASGDQIGDVLIRLNDGRDGDFE